MLWALARNRKSKAAVIRSPTALPNPQRVPRGGIVGITCALTGARLWRIIVHTLPLVDQHAPELLPGWKTLENPGISVVVPLAAPIALPFTGGADDPGSVPAPLTDNEPGPVHGSPVSGFVPVVLGRSPVGSAGETGFSVRAGKSVLLVLGIRLKVIPFCSVLAGFWGFRNGFCCANAIVTVAI